MKYFRGGTNEVEGCREEHVRADSLLLMLLWVRWGEDMCRIVSDRHVFVATPARNVFTLCDKISRADTEHYKQSLSLCLSETHLVLSDQLFEELGVRRAM